MTLIKVDQVGEWLGGRNAMRFKVWGILAIVAGSVASVAGCDWGTTSKPKSRVASNLTPSTEERAKAIYMVFPTPPDLNLQTWAMMAQREAGLLKAIFRVMGPGAAEDPKKQSDYIRDAIKDGADAIVVVAGSDPGLAQAIGEAQDKKVPVVILGRYVDLPAGKPPVPTIVPASSDLLARQLVDVTLADARKAGLPADGTAIVLNHKDGDMYTSDRVASLKKALDAAGVKKVEVVTFEGTDSAAAKTVVLATLRKLTDATIILAEGDEGLLGASQARRALKGKPLVFVSGFEGLWSPLQSYPYLTESAFVEFHLDNLPRLAVRNALALTRGEPVEFRVEPEGKFFRGRGEIADEFEATPKSRLNLPEPRKPGQVSDKKEGER